MEKIIKKLGLLRNFQPLPKYDNSCFLTDKEWEQVLSALEENQRLQEALENVKETIENCPEEEAVELLRFLFQLRKTVVKALTGK